MRRMKIIRWKNGIFSEVDDLIAEGSFLHVEIDDSFGFDTMISPEQIREFVFGNLFSEGLINKEEDVRSYHMRRKGPDIVVKLRLMGASRKPFERNYNIMWTDCASPSLLQKRMYDKFERIESNIRLEPLKLVEASTEMKALSGPYRETGALHSALLYDREMKLLAHANDISRHNAVDKVIGIQFLRGGSFRDTIIMTTGRVTSSLVLKCLRVGLPMILSRGAPLHDSVELARKYGMGIIGFLRGRRFNIYSGEDMVKRGEIDE